MGLQAQTAECLVVGEIATRHLCVVLNKVDLLPEDMRPRLITKAKKRIAQTLAATTFAGCPMIAVSAKPGWCAPYIDVTNRINTLLPRLQLCTFHFTILRI